MRKKRIKKLTKRRKKRKKRKKRKQLLSSLQKTLIRFETRLSI